MSEELVIRHCAPTLAALKTANLFSCTFESQNEMNESIRVLNRRLRKRGLRVLPLRYRERVGLIYVYRPGRLKKDLGHETACRLLRDCGYACEDPNSCLRRLMERLAEEDFPHEIGLFLGYPPEDVDGFIHRRGEVKLSGVWKVYGDVEAAVRTFERYRKCSRVYMRCWEAGHSIEKLTVAA